MTVHTEPMPLPEGTYLAHVVRHEGWYSQYEPLASDPPEISVMASEDGTGGKACAWEFAVEQVDLGRRVPSVRLRIFDEAFPAFAQIPSFFAALATHEDWTLDDVRQLLDSLGAVDETQRVDPNSPEREAERTG